MNAPKCLLPLAVLSVLLLAPTGAEAQAPPTITACQVTAAANDVWLQWTINGTYFQILVQVDGVVVATLPGTASSYLLSGPLPGPHVICIAALSAAGGIIQPVACCDVDVPGGGPVTGLTCAPIVGALGVQLNWSNGGAYSSIQIEVDGVLQAVLPGGATSHTILGLTPGGHTICVIPFSGAAPVPPPACCDVVVGGPVGPIDPLSCTPLATAPGVFLVWTNNGAYDAIEVRVNGALWAVLPGSQTSFGVAVLGPGAYTICLTPIVMGSPILPAACCDIVLGGYGPIDPLECIYDPAVPDAIFLSWTNNGGYSSIDVILDGVIVATLPGATTNYMLGGLLPGPHTVCLRAYVAGAALAPDACCDFAIPGATGPIDPLLCVVGSPSAPNDVVLTWTNNGLYSAIVVELDGVVVATLPGNATSHLLTGLSPGSHFVCLRAVLAGTGGVLVTCCQFSIDGNPIDPLFCEVVTTGTTHDVQLTWTNNGAYTSIRVELDGVNVAVLPGSATSYLLTGVPAGGHVVCVRPLIGATLLTPTCCQFSIDDPDPIDPLDCGSIPGLPGFSIWWTNGGAYTSIDVELDGAIVATLPGSATSYSLGGLSAGNHVVCVIPRIGAAIVAPVPCCTFTVPQLFVRGDSNSDGLYNIADGISLLAFFFSGGAAPVCDDAADSNDDGILNIADGIYILANLFSGGPPPPAPHPGCGGDPTNADVLGCASFPPCP